MVSDKVAYELPYFSPGLVRLKRCCRRRRTRRKRRRRRRRSLRRLKGRRGNRWWPPQDPKVVTRENYLGGKGAAPQSLGNGHRLIIYYNDTIKSHYYNLI